MTRSSIAVRDRAMQQPRTEVRAIFAAFLGHACDRRCPERLHSGLLWIESNAVAGRREPISVTDA
jgi:hypothetical protein